MNQKQNDWNSQVVAMTDARADQFAALLGSADAVERFKTVALNAVVNDSGLMNCDPLSVVEAIREAATLNLEPTGALGEAAIVPYKGKAQLQPMYRGYLKLARQSGQISAVDAQVVYVADEFDIALGTEPRILHVPFLNAPLSDKDAETRGDLRGVYAWARLMTSELLIEWMPMQEIELARRASPSVRAGRSSPWDGWYGEMARKTAIRRLVKRLPLSPQAQQLIKFDNEADDAERSQPKAIAASGAAGKALAAVARRREPEPAPVEDDEPLPPEPQGDPVSTLCGHLPDPNPLGIELACAKPSGHKGAHGSDGGTWPA